MKSRAIKKRQRQLAKRPPGINPARSRFLAASHDIRQPLHALGLFVAQLRSLAYEVELKRIVEQIDTAVSTLNERFIELLDGGPLGSSYGLQKLDEMRRHEYPAGFPVRLALKDLELVREVEQSSQAAMPVLDVVLERFLTANEDHADEDLAAVYEVGRSG